MLRGFTIRIHFPTGQPDGLRIISNPGWTGLALVFPHALLDEVRKRDELQGAGVYVLWEAGIGASALPAVYVGQSDALATRLLVHRDKDFWTQAVAFTTEARSLTGSHAEYLEASLIRLAKNARRCDLKNDNVPNLPGLSKSEREDAERFLDTMQLYLSIAGATFFDQPPVSTPKDADLLLRVSDAEARGVEIEGGFVVLKGSTAVQGVGGSIPPSLLELREDLTNNGTLVAGEGVLRFAQDYKFSSPSTAATIVTGRSANGRREWKDANGRSLGDIQAANPP